MRIVFGIHSLGGFGGTETYALTAADHLQRTGHDVVLHAREDGVAADAARALGLRVAVAARELPGSPDVCFVHDAVAAHELREACPDTPQVYCWHSEVFDLQLPPQAEGAVRLLVTMHDNAEKRIRALAVRPPVLRLRAPVDTQRFKPFSDIGERPRRLVAIGNYLAGEQAEKLRRACDKAGIAFRHVGAHGEGLTTAPEFAINDADIVAGKSRVVLEAMACGRAAYVYDAFGCDGWVTAETYPQLESTCFAGMAFRHELGVDELAADLLRYTPEMGAVNRDLAIAEHGAVKHAGELAEAFEQVAAAPPADADYAFELARLARVSWRHEGQAFELAYRLRDETERRERAERENAELTGRAEHAERTAATLVQSLRWRALTRLMRPLDRLRGRA